MNSFITFNFQFVLQSIYKFHIQLCISSLHVALLTLEAHTSSLHVARTYLETALELLLKTKNKCPCTKHKEHLLIM